MYIYSRQNIPLRNIFTSPFPYLHKEDCLQPLLFQGSTHHKEERFLSTRLRTRFGQLLSRFSSFRFTVTRNVFHQRFENVSPRSQPVTAEERSQACFRDKRKTGDCSSVHKHAYTHARTCLARFPSKNWSNLWAERKFVAIFDIWLFSFSTDPGLPTLSCWNGEASV